jgi:MFS family permease
MPDHEPSRRSGIPRNVVALGVASFLTDASSDMIYPLLPAFLTTVLGAGAVALGVIEGAAEATSSLFKIASGYAADKVRRRKPLVILGYSVSGLARPLIGLARSAPFVLGMRVLDRVGKGTRTSPRDALIADSTVAESRAMAYGFHRAMDHAGAVVGPMLAAVLLGIWGISLRHVFLWAAIPGVLVVITLVGWVREAPVAPESTAGAGAHSKRPADPRFRWLLASVVLFTLGNSSDAFILLRFSDVGVPVAMIAVLWAAHNAVRSVSTYLGGWMGDRVGRARMVRSGWLYYAVIYAGFGFVRSPVALVVVFLLYGVYYGLTEPSERAMVAGFVPKESRATAFGYYHAAVGVAALPASVIFGAVWRTWGATPAFLCGSSLAVLAALLLSWAFRSRVNT